MPELIDNEARTPCPIRLRLARFGDFGILAGRSIYTRNRRYGYGNPRFTCRLAFDKQTPQPFNIPPLQTVLLRLTGTLSFPYDNALEEGSKTTANYLAGFLAQPLQMKLELSSLDQGADTHVLTVPTEMGRSAPGTRSSSVAA